MNDLERMRHSASHVMAEAVTSIFPTARLAIGPPIEDGFYYDFELPRALTPDDLKTIEKKMKKIVSSNASFEFSEMSVEDALEYYRDRDQPYKVELIEDLAAAGEESVSFYTQNAFTDLCRGPHVGSTSKVGPFKLLNIAGAYWRGDEHRPMLQRIYGTAWPTSAELADHIHRMEEAQRRDHRRLGRELDLFSIHHDQTGAGLILWHPKGGRVRNEIENFWRDAHYDAGYDLVYTPHIGRSNLWQSSGHLDFFKENMFSGIAVDEQEYYLKPMNCPFHIMIYKNALRSYRDLPMRLGELGTVYRYERAGVLHGLMRVRGFTQDDSHIFCRPDQVVSELAGVLDLTMFILGAFGFTEFETFVSTRPEKAVGDNEQWDRATDALRKVLDDRGVEYEVDEGGGAFYGPKIDLNIKDAVGRAWQCTTVQFDFNLPERFDLSFIGADGKQHRPYMVHRALLGSMERFFGVLVENFAGAFPVWIAPTQVQVLPIADRHMEYAETVAAALKSAGLRAEIDSRREKVNYKIREAQLQKVPYMLIVGDREAQAGTVSVRLRTGENLGAQALDSFVALVKAVNDSRILELTPATG